MKPIPNLLMCVIVAVWIVAIALISVQNATPVSLRFLSFQSIQIPVGLVLAFSAGIGLIAAGILQPLWSLAGSQDNPLEEDAEFFVDDEDF